jgi:hypothetical protein
VEKQARGEQRRLRKQAAAVVPPVSPTRPWVGSDAGGRVFFLITVEGWLCEIIDGAALYACIEE